MCIRAGMGLLCLLAVVGCGKPQWRAQFGGPEAHTRRRLGYVEKALYMYRLSNGRYPDRLQVLLEPDPEFDEPFLQSLPADMWGHRLRYVVFEDGSFRVYSVGPDGVPHTDDDVHKRHSGC